MSVGKFSQFVVKCGLGVTVAAGAACSVALSQVSEGPPETPRHYVNEVIHGLEIVDPYRWLEDQTSQETRAWINAQNEYSQSVLRRFPNQRRLRERLAQLMKIETVKVPVERKGLYFFPKRPANQDLSVIYMQESSDGEDKVLVDPHLMSQDHTVSVVILDVSSDGTLLAYGVRRGGEDEVSVHLLDVHTGELLPDQLPEARYFGVSLAPDNSGFYYSKHDEKGPRIYYHPMGTNPSQDKEIFGNGYGPEKIVLCDLSEDGRHLVILVIHGSAADKTEIYFQDLFSKGPIETIVKDIPARFIPEIGDNEVFLHTNWRAPNGRVLKVDLRNSGQAQWKEIVAQGEAIIEDLKAAGGKLFVSYLENVQSRISIFAADGRYLRDIVFPAMGSVSRVSGRWGSDEVFFAFSSFHLPETIYRYRATSEKQTIWRGVRIPFDGHRFQIKQVWYESKDGIRVPMFIVHRKGIQLDGSNPALLTGYGGFSISLTPKFSARAALWLEHGGVYAVPNLRGGGELGEEWHRAGMGGKKQNVFDDFIGAAEWLIDNGYTNPSKLAIIGRSNGGLLVGAALTQRPELFQAVVCGYPLLDMVRYHRFLVARFWIPEYGSSEDPEQFSYIHAYSPYHRVKKGTQYPAVLLVTGDSDTRVDPLHARKMAALLQSATASKNPVLLLYDTQSGHSGGQPVSKQIHDLSNEMIFLFGQLRLQ
jgi:prolyl oligopeptidase